ncbi:hypothetical protein [Rhodosalinus sp. K401]|uniref:hypothetical protein n=1 Tax=Rhodosalinus sp. K401 TaxID=3239195 RepID=UPI0035255D9A
MAGHIWYIQSVSDPDYTRGYVPRPDPALTSRENRKPRLKVHHRARIGEPVAPEDLPETYVLKPSHPAHRLDVPLWFNSFIHVRDDMVKVLRRFDLGATVLRPIRVELGDGRGVDTRYATLLTSNVRPTIDPDASEWIGYGAVQRSALRSEGGVHPGVRAFPSVREGPAIWTDPEVAKTVFVNDDLAQALLSEPFANQLHLVQVLFSKD